MQGGKKLKVYERALEYTIEIYKFSSSLPKEERYNLISQIRRAVVSISLNISEGAASSTKREFAQCLSYAYRSTKEVLTCLELIEKLGLAKGELNKIKLLKVEGEELCKMIYGLRKTLVFVTEN